MFSGIVESYAEVLECHLSPAADVLRIVVSKPEFFDDIAPGHSICTSGVCLTVENFNTAQIQFALGLETLKITGWTKESLMGKTLNLERSMKMGDRIHGHFVTGHVDGLGKVIDLKRTKESLELSVKFSESLKGFFWKKGSVCINGVSLTVNEVVGDVLKVHLIPETLRLTNLGVLNINDTVNLEVDFMSRALKKYFDERFPNETSLRS